MSLTAHRGTSAIVVTFCIALLLTILPLPDMVESFRPQWVALVLIFWATAVPQRVGVGLGFILGILLDVMTATLLGQHALTLSVIAYITIKIHQRVRVFPLWQQALTVLLLLAMEHLINLWVRGATSQFSPELSYWLIPMIGALLWPWIFVMLSAIRQRYHVR